MEKDNSNQAAMLPYDKLAMLGIDRGKAESLPQEIKEKLSSGEVTPIMQVSISARNGNVITLPLKLQVVAARNGNPALLAYPVRVALEPERNKALGLTEHEAKRLRRGEVIQKTVDVDGGKTRQYLQLDPETKSVIHRKVTDTEIEQKLRDMEKVNDIELGTTSNLAPVRNSRFGRESRWNSTSAARKSPSASTSGNHRVSGSSRVT